MKIVDSYPVIKYYLKGLLATWFEGFGTFIFRPSVRWNCWDDDDCKHLEGPHKVWFNVPPIFGLLSNNKICLQTRSFLEEWIRRPPQSLSNGSFFQVWGKSLRAKSGKYCEWGGSPPPKSFSFPIASTHVCNLAFSWRKNRFFSKGGRFFIKSL